MKADLASLRRQFVLITVLTWLPIGFGMAVMLLLMDSRGLSLPVIGMIVSLYGLSTALLELPTGGLADLVSRRGVLAVSAGVGALAFSWAAVAATPWEFALIYLLMGLARALSSGPAEAWYVDSVRAVRSDGDICKGLAAARAASAVSLGVGTVGGGALAVSLPLADEGLVTSLSAPMLLSALLSSALLVVALRSMWEPVRPSGRVRPVALLAAVPRTVAGGVRLGIRNRVLSRLLLTFVPIGVGLIAVELLTPGRLLALTGDAGASASAYGVITAVGFAAAALGSVLSGLLARLVGGSAARAAVCGTAVSSLGLVALFVTGGLSGAAGVVATGGGYALLFFGAGLRGPVQAELVHGQVGAGERATVISIESLLMQASGSAAALVLPWLVGVWSVPGAWLLAGVLLAGSTVLFAGAGRVERPAASLQSRRSRTWVRPRSPVRGSDGSR
ncbi:hypothetical protein GCM10027447_38920 [Glycomyces halotolerans]